MARDVEIGMNLEIQTYSFGHGQKRLRLLVGSNFRCWSE